jgi:mycothiol synthase
VNDDFLRPDQVLLRCDSLSNLPPPQPPAGYTLRTFRRGDEAAWQALYDAAFPRIPGRVAGKVADLMADPIWQPDRTFFVCTGDVPAAAALAWEPYWDAPGAASVHWVATHPRHRRRGLARTAVLAVLDWMRRHGRAAAVLSTETYRLPAIRMYLGLGFRPDFAAHETMPARWRIVCEALERMTSEHERGGSPQPPRPM